MAILRNDEMMRLASNTERYCTCLIDLLYRQYKIASTIAQDRSSCGKSVAQHRQYVNTVTLDAINALMCVTTHVKDTARNLSDILARFGKESMAQELNFDLQEYESEKTGEATGNSKDLFDADRRARKLAEDLFRELSELSGAIVKIRDDWYANENTIDFTNLKRYRKDNVFSTMSHAVLLDKSTEDPFLPLASGQWYTGFSPDLYTKYGMCNINGRFRIRCSEDGIVRLILHDAQAQIPVSTKPYRGVSWHRVQGEFVNGTDDYSGFIDTQSSVLSADQYVQVYFLPQSPTRIMEDIGGNQPASTRSKGITYNLVDLWAGQGHSLGRSNDVAVSGKSSNEPFYFDLETLRIQADPGILVDFEEESADNTASVSFSSLSFH